MLGLGRASEYAGWWTGKPSFASTSATTATTVGQFNGFSSQLVNNDWNTPALNGNPTTFSFDNTGIVNARAQVAAVTLRFDVMSNYNWVTDTATGSLYQSVKTNSTTLYPPSSALLAMANNTGTTYTGVQIYGLCRTVTTNRYAIFYNPNGYGFIPFTTSFDTLANTWITIVVAQAPTSASFSNWTGGTPQSGNFYPVRACIINSQTGDLIEKVDINTNQFQGYSTTYATETWYPYSNATGPGSAYFYTQSQSKFDTAYNPTPNVYYASTWACVGEVFDPTATTSSVSNYRYLCGSNLPGTVASVQAWVNWSSASSATSGVYTGLTQLGAGRMTQTNNFGQTQFTANLSSPYQSTTIRP
jgi:hypothetical protein